MVLAGPRNREQICARITQQRRTERGVIRVARHAPITSRRPFRPERGSARSGNDATEHAETTVHLADVVQQRRSYHRAWRRLTELRVHATGDTNRVSAVESLHAAPQGDFTFNEVACRPGVIGSRWSARPQRTEETAGEMREASHAYR